MIVLTFLLKSVGRGCLGDCCGRASCFCFSKWRMWSDSAAVATYKCEMGDPGILALARTELMVSPQRGAMVIRLAT